MNIEEMAKAYVQCVELEETARTGANVLAEDLSVLRADLHALWMDALREAKIPFADRSEAAHLAYDIATGKQPAQH